MLLPCALFSSSYSWLSPGAGLWQRTLTSLAVFSTTTLRPSWSRKMVTTSAWIWISPSVLSSSHTELQGPGSQVTEVTSQKRVSSSLIIWHSRHKTQTCWCQVVSSVRLYPGRGHQHRVTHRVWSRYGINTPLS